MNAPACSLLPDVDRHFDGRLGPARETRLRAHLVDCDVCRARYARHLKLAVLDPRALPFETRMAFGLGVRRPAARPWWTAACAAALAVGIVLLVPRPPQAPLGLRTRGTQPPAFVISLDRGPTEVIAFRTAGAGGPALATRLSRADELAFAYRNGGGWERLMIFGRDDRGGVYWFQPAWTDPTSDPGAVAVSRAPGAHELPTAVAHTFQGQRLDLCALVTRAPLTVREVETALDAAPTRSPAEVLAARGKAACTRLEVGP